MGFCVFAIVLKRVIYQKNQQDAWCPLLFSRKNLDFGLKLALGIAFSRKIFNVAYFWLEKSRQAVRLFVLYDLEGVSVFKVLSGWKGNSLYD